MLQWAGGGRTDTLVLGTSAARRRGSTPLLPIPVRYPRGSSSVVERYLAKVDVASSSLVSRFKKNRVVVEDGGSMRPAIF